jgi:hypothetical protein
MCWVDGYAVRVFRKPSPTGKALSTPYQVSVRRDGLILFTRGFIDYPKAVLFAHWCVDNYEVLEPARRAYKERYLLGPIVNNLAQTYSQKIEPC